MYGKSSVGGACTAAQDVARLRAPQAHARPARGDVVDAHVAAPSAAGASGARPGRAAERRAGDDPEAVLGQAGDGEVGTRSRRGG